MAVDMVAGAVKKILDTVVDGTFVEEDPLPAEADLARFLDVSRPTMREAVRTLSLGGVLNVVHGRGTFLLPRFRWGELRYLMYVSAHEGNAVEVEVKVLGVEEMIEVGAVRLAARNRTEEDLAEMRRCVEQYAVADHADDVQALVGIDYAWEPPGTSSSPRRCTPTGTPCSGRGSARPSPARCGAEWTPSTGRSWRRWRNRTRTWRSP